MQARARLGWLGGMAMIAGGLTLVGSWACSSSDSGAPSACTPGGAACASGETCWPLDSTGTFGCVAAFDAGFGAACEDTFGVATCGAALSCDEPSASGGTCTSYCSATQACPAGYSCYQVSAGDAGLTLCRTSPDSGSFLGVDLLDGGNSGIADPDYDGGIYVDSAIPPGSEAGNELPQ